MTKEDILHNESWQNIIMISAVAPSYEEEEKEQPVDFFQFCKKLAG